MANLPFSLLEEPETRQPSKVRLILLVLFLLLIILSALFIGLYIIEKTKPTDSSPAKCSSAACITSAAGMFNMRLNRYVILHLVHYTNIMFVT